ncbi:MAG: family transcriptional regulator, cyclic receptor protein [Solirubrobacterales bacterium]|nr:family transcriptional regulator, cyclic receptor protein [Solirubrobacterales bacterium]
MPGERSIELLGPGDVLIPPSPDDSDSVPSGVCWEALGAAHLAVLKRELLNVPEVAAPMMMSIASRLNQRAHRASVQAAIAGLHPIERRLEFLLWHLADRWGRRGPGGVTLRIKLTQRTLAALAGTERSTICRSLIELEEKQVIARLPGKQVQLLAEPPGERLIDLALERISAA